MKNAAFNYLLHKIALQGGEGVIFEGEENYSSKDFKICVVNRNNDHTVAIALRPKTKEGKYSLRLGKITLLKNNGLSNQMAKDFLRQAVKTPFGLENRVMLAAINNEISQLPRTRRRSARQLARWYENALVEWYKSTQRPMLKGLNIKLK